MNRREVHRMLSNLRDSDTELPELLIPLDKRESIDNYNRKHRQASKLPINCKRSKQ